MNAATQQPDWPRVYGEPLANATLRATPEDFVVDETLSFEPTGEGEHHFLQIKKRGANTEWVARQLAKFAGVTNQAVSYAGLKDRHAVTTQWFSVHIPGKSQPDWQMVNNEEFYVCHATRHIRKLKRGAIAHNRFEIVLRDIESADLAAFDARLTQIREHGVPNYFGPQRFGRQGANIALAEAWLAGEKRIRKRAEQSLLLSVARSRLFNDVLAERVHQHSWNTLQVGDIAMLNGSNSVFEVETLDAELQQRVTSGDVHPSGPLWGENPPTAPVLQQEAAWLATSLDCCQALEKKRVAHQRRSLRVRPQMVEWAWLDNTSLTLRFALPRGSYATSVLQECVSV